MIIYNYSKNFLSDKRSRKLFKENELKKIILKSLIYSKFIEKKRKLFFYQLFQNLPKRSSLSALRTHCLLSGSGKFVFRRFRLGRHFAKSWACEGNLMGLKKSSF